MQHCWRNAKKERNEWQSKHMPKEREGEEKAKDEMRKNGNKKLYRLDQIYDSSRSAGKRKISSLLSLIHTHTTTTRRE
jgi:predicted patatin/cPLA2 family phospholipase